MQRRATSCAGSRLLRCDLLEDFFAVNGDISRRPYADAHLAAVHADDDYLDLVTDSQGFAYATSKN
jgi:hypothetical protein